jgi:hypothetical protein
MKGPHVTNDSHKDDLFRRTRAVWQPRLGRDLSREDARQIAENMTGFFTVLAEWSCADLPPRGSEAASPNASINAEAHHDR